MNLTTAEGYFDLGMFEDAWNATEELPPLDRVEPLVLELRLRILTATGQWDLGDHIANVLVCSDIEPEKCRETVARFRHAHARHLCESGLMVLAKEQVRLAVDAWEPIRAEIVEDDGLVAVWDLRKLKTATETQNDLFDQFYYFILLNIILV